MDIAFHYFAVKTLAKEAGFPEAEAQRIATFSQYIDDFDWITYLDCKNIPDYIKEDKNYDLYLPSLTTLNMNFNPTMTGFLGYIDMAFLLLERSQKFTVSAFHFIPRSVADISPGSRTTPAIVGDESFISDLVIEARTLLLAGNESRQISLMRLGMALHTFADTYAHQLFTGYNTWENDVKIKSVTDNITNTDLTKSFLKEMDRLGNVAETQTDGIIPPIGHALAGHTPDLTNVSFEMSYKANKDDKNYSKMHVRSNTSTFLIAARHILNLLRSCLGQAEIEENAWKVLSEKLAAGFLFPLPTKDIATKLTTHWKSIFATHEYHYSKEAIDASFYLKTAHEGLNVNSPFGKKYTEDFYRYNYIADTQLIKMYGPHPRSSWWN